MRLLFASAFFIATVCFAPPAARACKPLPDNVPPPKGPLNRGEAFAALAGVGIATGAGSISIAWALDATGRYPTLMTALATVPGVALSSYFLMPTPRGGGDCSDGTLHYDEFAERAWVPAALSILPAVLAWWVSDASIEVAFSPDLRPDYGGLTVTGRW